VWQVSPGMALQQEKETIEKLEKASYGDGNDRFFNERSYFCGYLSYFIHCQSDLTTKNTNHIKKARYQLLTIMATLLLKLDTPAALKNYKEKIDVDKINDNELQKVFIKTKIALEKYTNTLDRVDHRHFYGAPVLGNIWSYVEK
jgi:hypothetical protein